MKVLLVGGGGRESALAYKLSQSPLLTKLFIVGGNPAMERYGTLLTPQDFTQDGAGSFSLNDKKSLTELARWSKENSVELVISGPEAPICAGLTAAMAASGVRCFAPEPHLAQLESSKEFAKQILTEAAIPTASYRVAFSPEEAKKIAFEYAHTRGGVVVKADGLAGGKGVFVCHDIYEATKALSTLYGSMSHATKSVVIEEMLNGEECSYFALISGKNIIPMGFVRDYKRLFDKDKGPNTGGMGAYAPVNWLPQDAEARVIHHVLNPLLHYLGSAGHHYEGFLYVGIMWTDDGPSVLEFNIRLGDPECQVLALADPRDWLSCIMEITESRQQPQPKSLTLLRPPAIITPTVGLVCASDNYPWYTKPSPSHLLPEAVWAESSTVFAGNGASTMVFGGAVHSTSEGLHSGKGRILTIVSSGKNHSQCRAVCYQKAEKIKEYWPSVYYRHDIAAHLKP